MESHNKKEHVDWELVYNNETYETNVNTHKEASTNQDNVSSF